MIGRMRDKGSDLDCAAAWSVVLHDRDPQANARRTATSGIRRWFSLFVMAGACSSWTSLQADDADVDDSGPRVDCDVVAYVAGETVMGLPCSVSSDCPSWLAEPVDCLHSFVTPRGEYSAPGGYCARAFLCPVDPACGVAPGCHGLDGLPDQGSGCVSLDGSSDGLCIRLCHADADCRSGYGCMPVPPYVGYRACLPTDLRW